MHFSVSVKSLTLTVFAKSGCFCWNC